MTLKCNDWIRKKKKKWKKKGHCYWDNKEILI